MDSVTVNAATGDIQGKYKNHDEFRSTIPPTYNDFYTTLLDNSVAVKVEKDNSGELGFDPGESLPVRAAGWGSGSS